LVMVFAWLAGACLVWKIIAGILIVRRLERRGTPINYWAVRILVYKYAWEYRNISMRETGKVDPLFIHFAAPAVLMWIFVVAALVLIAS
jgi:hypothetical protein